MTSNTCFAGRGKEIRRLTCAHADRLHTLIVGPAGTGKTALLMEAQKRFGILLCREASSMLRICDCFEHELGWKPRKQNMVKRKNRLLHYLAQRGEPVALDGVESTTPKVARFIQALIERVPVWIACRSTQAKEIGSVWQSLHNFDSITLGALSSKETSTVVRFAVATGRVAPSVLTHASKLHRLCGGNARALQEFLAELSSRDYDLSKPGERRLLHLDRRIHHAANIVNAQYNAKLPRKSQKRIP